MNNVTKVVIHIPPTPESDYEKVDWLDILNKEKNDLFLEKGEEFFWQTKISTIRSYTAVEYLEPGKFPKPNPIIDGLISEKEFHILSAPSKVGKTILGLNLAIAVAMGQRFLGYFRSLENSVFIIQTEVSDAMFSTRLRQMLDGLGLKEPPTNLHIASQRIKLDEPDGLKDLKLKIKELGIKLLILDPFYTLHNSDEDKAKDMAPLLANLREMIIEMGVTCILIHHQGKMGEHSSRQTGHKHRGSSSFADVPDGSWSLNKKQDDNDCAVLSFELRNLKCPTPMSIKLDDNLQWAYVGEEWSLSAEEKSEELASLLDDGEGVTKEQFQDLIFEKLGKKSRTADTLIRNAIKRKAIVTVKDGKVVKHFLPDSVAFFEAKSKLSSSKSNETCAAIPLTSTPFKTALNSDGILSKFPDEAGL
jgi:hypothetical protein